jgi:peptide/nickel transport system permease protein
MLWFLTRRSLQGLLVIWGIVSLLFLIFYTLGDPAEYVVGDQADETTKAAIREKYGLDKPLPVQYIQYINRLSPVSFLPDSELTGTSALRIFSAGKQSLVLKGPDLGRSYQSQNKVAEMIGSRVEGTLILAGAAILFAAVLGILLGLIAALRKDSWIDRTILSTSVLGISAPSFFIGILIAWLFAVRFRDWTGLNVTGYLFEEQIFLYGRKLVLKNLLLPAIALGIRPLAVFIQLTRSSMIEVLDTDYIRTAKAKGLGRAGILFRHGLRNGLNPVLTSVSGWLASLLAGAFFIEYIFNWQGLGKLTIDALNTNDFPVILGCAIFIGLIFVLVSILTDLMYAILDPRIRLGR